MNQQICFQGKVEAEIQMLSKEDAERNPAGYGRSEPSPLDPPKFVNILIFLYAAVVSTKAQVKERKLYKTDHL